MEPILKVVNSLFLLLGCLSLVVITNAQKNIPNDVRQVINKARHKEDLLTVIHRYSQNKQDNLKLKAAFFLIANMDVHFSQDYYWADSLGRRIDFNELNYSSFKASVRAFDSLKLARGKVHPVPIVYYDADTITSSFLISNIDNAFKVWDQQSASFDDFCEYILPYRISVEPIQDWRSIYHEKFIYLRDNYGSLNLKLLIRDINNWFVCMYNLEKRIEPLPRLGALQILHRRKGFCEDVASLSSFALRTAGFASSVDIVPFWATSSGSHTLNYTSKINGDVTHFDVLFKSDSIGKYDGQFAMVREPGKVYRQTFSKQKNAIANQVDESQIPEGILQSKCIADVTGEYWQVCGFSAMVKPRTPVFSCVLNHLKWQPVAGSVSTANGVVSFDKMSVGVVYLPMYYINGKLRPAAYPVAVGGNQTKELVPDLTSTRTVKLDEQEYYLRIKTGKKYRLYYWNSKWKQINTKKTSEKATSLVFENVPKNALLLLLPEEPTKKERPFIITDEGKRVWF